MAGIGIDEVLRTRYTWDEAAKLADLTPYAALAAGGARAVLWHLLQPIAYAMALMASWPQVSPLQRVLGIIVAVREIIYVLLVGVGIRCNPAYLLVDTAATWKEPISVALSFIVLYVIVREPRRDV